MSTNFFKFTAIFLLSAGCLSSCSKKDDNISRGVFYVVGYRGPTNIQNDGTAKAAGYVFISKNLKDTLYANNIEWLEDIGIGVVGDLLDGIFAFPSEIMRGGYCWEGYFPQEYRFVYKAHISYRPMTKEELQESDYPCLHDKKYPNLFFHAKRITIISIK